MFSLVHDHGFHNSGSLRERGAFHNRPYSKTRGNVSPKEKGLARQRLFSFCSILSQRHKGEGFHDRAMKTKEPE